MGGKTKQRTKNNARPSSSSRSAELLSSAVTADGGLVNLSTGKVLPALFPTLAAASFEQGLNPDFQMCIKKLNKKDPITKTKALQELCELVKNGNVDDVVAALPSWAHFYKTLTIDTDRKVREMAQVCHGAIMTACGRRAAPQLRRLLPAWLQAQYDEHAPAMAAAQHSLTNTFPDSKLPEVISFCKAEVMTHLIENLVGSAEAVISKKTESAEEKELQMCRLVSSSLQGLEYMTQHLPPAHSPWLWTELAALLRDNAFWQYATHNAHQVRAAWYGAVGRIMERYRGTFGEKYGVKTMRILLAAAKEQSSPVAAQLWGCLLMLMHNMEGWHTYLDKKDLLIKRILDVLQNGGWGDARHLSNMLLPILAHLPEDMVTKDFYESFFKSIFVGLEKKNILNSKSERQSWITSLAECLRYLSIQQYDFVVGVATSVHRTWLEKILSTQLESQTRTNLIKCSTTNMSSIVKYWLKQSKEENSEKYDQLVRNFWLNVGSTILTQIDKSSTDQDEIGILIDGHILLLQTLKTSFSQDTKKQHSIKFDGDEQTVVEKPVIPTQQCDASIVERYKHNLDDLVQRICSHYFEFAAKKEVSNAIMMPLITLLVEFDSKDLFVAIARQFDVDTVYKFYEKVLKSWLAGDTMRCKAVVDIVFLMMKHMSEEEQDMMFSSFNQFPPSVEEWCMSVCVAHPHRRAAAARRWLRAPAATRAVQRLCARAAHHDDCGARSLLLVCLDCDRRAEPLISQSAVSSILTSFTAAISDPRGPALERSAAFAAQLATRLHDRPVDPHYVDLVHGLFRLNILVPRGDSRLSAGAWCEVRSSWQDGVAALPPLERAMFLQAAARFMHTQLFLLSETLDIIKLEHIVSLCPHLFNLKDDLPDDVTEVITFTKQLFDIKEDSNAVEVFAVRHECVTSQLNCLDENDNDVIRQVIAQSSDIEVSELTKTDLMQYVNKLLFRAIYLRTLLLHRATDDENNEEKNWCDYLLNNDYIEKEFCNVVYGDVVLNSLHEGYAFWPHYDIIEKSKQKLDLVLSDILASSSQDTKTKLLAALSALAARHGYHWALARRRGEVRVAGGSVDDGSDRSVVDAAQLTDVSSGTGFFHCLQANTRWCSDEQLSYETKYLVMVRSVFAAHGDVIGEEFLADAARCRGACDLDVVVNAYYRHNHTMLYERDISDAPWSHVASNAAVAEFVAALVARHGWAAPAHHWDFATIAMCSLLSSLDKAKHRWGSTKVSMLARSALRLYNAVQEFISGVKSQCIQRAPLPHVADLPTEWRDIFAADTHCSLFSIAVHVMESCTTTPITSNHVRVLGGLTAATRQMEWEALGQAHRHGSFSLKRLARLASATLQEPVHHACKYFAYYLCTMLTEPLVLEDASKLALWSEEGQAEGEDERSRPELSLDYFDDAFLHLHALVDAALTNVVVGEETCEMVVTSDSHSVALGWLLLADLMAAVCRLARGDLVHHHIQMYRERKYAEAVLCAALRLLPAQVFARAQAAAGGAPAPASCQHMFDQLGPLDVDAAAGAGAGSLGALACRALATAVCGAGCGAARGWWGAASARAQRLLERVVRAHVAPRAVRQQLLALQQRAHEIHDAEIRIAWSTSEVTCVYSVEEREIELRVWLSHTHPLTAPRLAAPDAAAPGANTHWLALYLAYQNGTLLNALKMWTRAVDARVESAPQCYICYCRLHPATGRLPRVPCHQCNNKFHNTCLRKWFTTSNKSSCPLCRSTF